MPLWLVGETRAGCLTFNSCVICSSSTHLTIVIPTLKRSVKSWVEMSFPLILTSYFNGKLLTIKNTLKLLGWLSLLIINGF